MPQVLHLNFKDAGTFTLLTAVLDCKRPTKIFEFATRPDALFHVQEQWGLGIAQDCQA